MQFYDQQKIESVPSVVEGLHMVETQEEDYSPTNVDRKSSLQKNSVSQVVPSDQKYILQLKEINRELSAIHIPTFLAKNKKMIKKEISLDEDYGVANTTIQKSLVKGASQIARNLKTSSQNSMESIEKLKSVS